MNAQFQLEYYREFGKLPPPENPTSALTDEAAALSEAFSMPPEKAVAFFKSKGYEVTWDWKAKAAEFHQQSFTVAKVMQADLLQFYKSEIQKAIDTGSTFAKFKNAIQTRLSEAGWTGVKPVADPITGITTNVNLGTPSRLKTIYQTNLQSAYMNGRFEQMKETTSSHPYGMYWNSDPKSPICKEVSGKVVRLDDPHLRMPPFHYNCKTTLDPISEVEAKREGYEIADAKSTYHRGGGVDAQFDAHPDRAWKPDITKYDDDIAAQLTNALKRQTP